MLYDTNTSQLIFVYLSIVILASAHSLITDKLPSAKVTSLLRLQVGMVIWFFLQKTSEITVTELPVSIKACTGLFSKAILM